MIATAMPSDASISHTTHSGAFLQRCPTPLSVSPTSFAGVDADVPVERKPRSGSFGQKSLTSALSFHQQRSSKTSTSTLAVPRARGRRSNPSHARPSIMSNTMHSTISKSDDGLDTDLTRELREVVRTELRTFSKDLKNWMRDALGVVAQDEGKPRRSVRQNTQWGYYTSEAESIESERARGSVMSPSEHRRSSLTLSAPDLEKINLKLGEEEQEELDPQDEGLRAAIVMPSLDQARICLEGGADPNATVSRYRRPGFSKQYREISFLAMAVINGNIDMARVLIKAGADPDSQYGFQAGRRAMPWIGSAIFAALPDSNLEMVRELVELRANPHDVSSNGANLVWQCSYFGHVDILSVLLEWGVACNIRAESQNFEGISHSPLHIAAVLDRESVISKLISAKADINVASEDGKTPLVDAIEHGFYGVVRVLVSKGAILVPWKGMNGKDNQIQRPLDILFNMSNPVLVRAAALGLRDQEQQLQSLTVDDLLLFLSTTSANSEILHAVFKRRILRYWSDKNAGMVVKTAFIRDCETLDDGSKARFVNMAVSKLSFARLEGMNKHRQQPDHHVSQFLASLAPQSPPYLMDKCCLRNVFRRRYSMTSIVTYESLLPQFHDDLRILRRIADTSTHEDFFGLDSVQAILRNAWFEVWPLAVGEFIMHIMLLAIYAALAERMANTVPCIDQTRTRCDVRHSSYEINVKSVSEFGIPVVILLFLKDVLLFVAFVQHGWAWPTLKDTMCSLSASAGFLHKFSDALIIGTLIYTDAECTAHMPFRIFFACGCVTKWMQVVFCLTPVRRISLALMPIFFTLREIWTFAAIFGACIMAFFTAMISFGVTNDVWSNTLMDVFLFGQSGEPDYLSHRTYAAFRAHVFERQVMRLFAVSLTFFVSVTMMNCFIAAMTATYQIGSSNKCKLYFSSLARDVVRFMAVRKSLQRLRSGCRGKAFPLFGAAEEDNEHYLWYSVEAAEAF